MLSQPPTPARDEYEEAFDLLEQHGADRGVVEFFSDSDECFIEAVCLLNEEGGEIRRLAVSKPSEEEPAEPDARLSHLLCRLVRQRHGQAIGDLAISASVTWYVPARTIETCGTKMVTVHEDFNQLWPLRAAKDSSSTTQPGSDCMCNDNQERPETSGGHPVFELGQIVITRNAHAKLAGYDVLTALARHVAGDWGDVSDDDRQENELSVREGLRIMSVYHGGDGTKFWIITEADRSATTVLLPEDY